MKKILRTVLFTIVVVFSICLVSFSEVDAASVLKTYPVFSSNFSNGRADTSWGEEQAHYGPRVNKTLYPYHKPTIVYENGCAIFRNSTYLEHYSGGYSYLRMTAMDPLNNTNLTQRNNDLGTNKKLTVEFSVNLDKLYPTNNPTQNGSLGNPKCGQTGLVFNIRMAKYNKELYFCIFGTEQNQGKTTEICVSNYSCDRDMIDYSVPEYSDFVSIESGKFQKIALIYDGTKTSGENKISLYINGVKIKDFFDATYGRNDALAKDFVCISLVGRELNADCSQFESAVLDLETKLDYVNIYNEIITPPLYSSNTPLIGQCTNYTCGSASAKMILASFSVEKTESEIWNHADRLGDPTGVEMLTETINYFLDQENVQEEYDYSDNNEATDNVLVDSASALLLRIRSNLQQKKPVQILLRISSTYQEYFGNNSLIGGHYVVVNGISMTADGEWLLEILDPWDSDPYYRFGEYEGQFLRVPLNIVYSCFSEHSESLIFST